MKTLFFLSFLTITYWGCKQDGKEEPLKFEDTIQVIETKDTLLASLNEHLKSVKEKIHDNEVQNKRVKDSLHRDLTITKKENKSLEYVNKIYMDAIDGMSETIIYRDSIKK